MVEKNGLCDIAKYLFEVSFIGVSIILALLISTSYNPNSPSVLNLALGSLLFTSLSSLACLVFDYWKWKDRAEWNFYVSLSAFAFAWFLLLINFFHYLVLENVLNFLDNLLHNTLGPKSIIGLPIKFCIIVFALLILISRSPLPFFKKKINSIRRRSNYEK